jgi:hypothetical protein
VVDGEPSRWPEQATAPAKPGFLSAGASRLAALRVRGKIMLVVAVLGLAAAAIGVGLHRGGEPAGLELSAQKKIQTPPR